MCTFIAMGDNTITRSSNCPQEIERFLKDNILQQGNFVQFLNKWKPSIQQLIPALEHVCQQDLPEQIQKKFFLTEIITNMMSLDTDVLVRDNLIEIGIALCRIIPLSKLTPKEYEVFQKNVYSKYIPAISQLRDSNYQNWHKLWIFLVRFCSKKIHESVDLANRLLRIVEYAFRNSSYEQRLKGYDCWKELIDNASLDPNHISTSKQIKLLITPLKAKFSKQEVVICKRFDVFVHLLYKLQQNAVLCLPEFLKFCFGSSTDTEDASSSPSRSGQAKSVPQIWAKSAKVLISILGHSHDTNVDCIAEDFKFDEPILNVTNFEKFYKIIILSVGDCGSLLKDEDLESKREKVLRCMWQSLFNLVVPAVEAERIKYFEVIADVLDNYILQSNDTPYYENLLVLIFVSLMEFDKDGTHDCIPLVLKQLLTVFLTMDTGTENTANDFKQVIAHSFTKVILEENKVKMIETVLDCLSSLKIEEKNLSNYAKIWILLAHELTTDFTTEKIVQFSNFDKYFMWPLLNLHHLDISNKKQMVLHWMKLYRKVTLDSESKKIEVLKDLEKNFKNNPLISSNVVALLNVVSQFETKFSKEFVMKLMDVASLVLEIPNLPTEEEQKLSSLVIIYFDPNLECYTIEDNDDLIKNICVCIEYILSIHSGYKLIDSFVGFFKSCPVKLQEKFSLYLKKCMGELLDKETDVNSYNAKEISKCLALFTDGTTKDKEDDKKTFIVPTGRSARIANMGKNSPTSPNRKAKTPTNLRLFGKDPETMSPLNVKGSQLNLTPTKKKKKGANIVDINKKNTRPIGEENSSDFVPIDSEVKVQINKMSEHQKEMFKKRREDIPALYQDLSQSASQDMFSSKSNSKDAVEQLAKPTSEIAKSESDMFSETPKEAVSKSVNKETEKIIKPVTNESEEKKIVLTSSDLFSNEDHAKASKESKKSTDSDKIEEASSKSSDSSHNIEVSTPNRKGNQHLNERKKKKELERLKMDIVNADQYFESPRRTREKKVKKTDESVNKKEKNNKKSTKTVEGNKSDENEKEKPKDNININKETVEVAKVSDPVIDRNNSHQVKSTELEIKLKRRTKKSKTTGPNIETVKESDTKETKTIKKLESNTVEIDTSKSDESLIENEIKTPQLNKINEYKNAEVKTPQLNTVKEHKNVNESPGKKRGRPKLSLETRAAKIIQKLESPLKSSERIAKQKLEKEIEDSKKSKETDTPKKQEKSHKKNLFLKFTTPNENKDNKIKEKEESRRLTLENKVSETSDVNSTQVSINKDDTNISDKNKGEKRKLTDDENEDIIESSQESFAETVSLLNSSKKKQLKLSIDKACTSLENKSIKEPSIDNHLSKTDLLQGTIDVEPFEEVPKEINTTQDTTLTQDNSQDSILAEEQLPKDSVLTDSTLTQPTPLVVTEMFVESPEPPKKPQLTESDLIMCQMDTMSVCGSKDSLEATNDLKNEEEKSDTVSLSSVEDILATSHSTESISSTAATPTKSRSIPSSPITADTPNRTNELLGNTMDISPIRPRHNSEDISEEIPIAKPIRFLLKDDLNDGDKVDEVRGNIEQDKNMDEVPNGEVVVKEDALVGGVEEKEDTFEDDNSSDEFEHMDASSEAEMTPLETSSNQYPTDESPPQLEHFEEPPIQNGQVSTTINIVSNKTFKEPLIQERASKIQHFIQAMVHKPFLKRKGGATSSPSALRIKKMMNNVCQKQEVTETVETINEEDILTFSREIPSPLAVPRSSILKRKFSDSSDTEGISPCAKRKRVNFSDPCLTSKKLFIKDDFPEDSAGSELSTETDSDVPETEPSLVVVNPMILQRNKPIFPKLMDCKDDVIIIVKRITSPMFVPALMNKLKGKNVKTIGDLATLSESEVNRFPFKVPVVANVIKALENYHRKKGDTEEKPIENVNGDVEMPKLDVKLEFKMLIRRAVREKVPIEELAKILFPHIDNVRLISLIKNHVPNLVLDALEEKDYTPILKQIVNLNGISEILKRAHLNFYNEEKEPEFYSSIVDYVKYTVPLEKFFRGRNLEDLEVGIEESIKNKVFQRNEVLQYCLFPLLDSPKDIFPYLDTLSQVQVDEIIINRLENQNIGEFFEKLMKTKQPEEIKQFSENLWSQQPSTSSEIISCLENKIQSQTEECRKDILVRMFEFCSQHLDSNTLLELHVSFLKRISNSLSNK